MQSAILVALAATTFYAHGTCSVAPQSMGLVPQHTALVGFQSAGRAGGHCTLAALPFTVPAGARVVAYLSGSTLSASDGVPTPWECYTLSSRLPREAKAGGSQAACAAFPTVDALPGYDPFS